MSGIRGRHVEFDDINEDELKITEPAQAAAGVKGVTVALERGLTQGGGIANGAIDVSGESARWGRLPGVCLAGIDHR